MTTVAFIMPQAIPYPHRVERERKLYYKEYFIPISGDNDKYTRYTELSSYLTK